MAGLRFTDIAVNGTDTMFHGIYNSSQKHAPDFLTSVLPRAAAANVHRVILTGTSVAESRAALDLARHINAGESGVRAFSTVGLHPTSSARELDAEAARGDGSREGALARMEAELEALAAEGAADGTVVAIGECGLDYDRLHFAPRDVQASAFPLHVRIARNLGLPLFLHDRNTGGDLLRALAEAGGAPRGGVVHSFTGTADDIAAIVGAGLYVGVNGCAMKTAEGLEAIARVPLERLMLETDAPWCSIKASSPAAQHVKTTWAAVKKEKWHADATVKDRSEPCHVRNVAEAFAGVSGLALDDVARAAEANVAALFFPTRGETIM